ncbi:MAG: hypothetical protein V4576_00970 [Patescibacteria group bacterium]
MKIKYIILAILFIICIGYFALKTYPPAPTQPVDQVQTIPEEQVAQNTVPPTFKWIGEPAAALNLDGLPKTNVFVEVTYSDGTVAKKLIDTPDGSCNDLKKADSDSVASTTIFQCYAAGFGYHYKIVRAERSYLVLRKGFEESGPEYTPPEMKYEPVSEFPLSN